MDNPEARTYTAVCVCLKKKLLEKKIIPWSKLTKVTTDGSLNLKKTKYVRTTALSSDALGHCPCPHSFDIEHLLQWLRLYVIWLRLFEWR